jgi:small-conductance mechanosensitive channel
LKERIAQEHLMKWMQMYLAGYVIVIGGLVAALWKLGVIDRVGPAWTAIGLAIAVGLGMILSVSHSGNKETVEIDQKR